MAGLLYAAAHGCLSLGGREKDMLAALRTYGVVLPPGALSGVLRLFLLLGCPLVSQPKPAKDRRFSKLWRLDFVVALDVEDPRHLEFVRSLRTPPRPREPDEPHEREGEEADDEPRRTAAPASDPQVRGPREGAREPASEPGDAAGVAADPSTQRNQATALPETLQTFMRLMLGALTLLAQQMTMLHQRVEATELAAQAVKVEPAVAAEEHGEPAASVDAGEDVVETAAGADRRIDQRPGEQLGVVETAAGGADPRPGEQLGVVETAAGGADPRPGDQLADLVETAAAAVDPRPGPDELTANTSLRPGDERDEIAGSSVDANERPGRTGVALHLDGWSLASSVLRAHVDAQLLANAGGWIASTAHTLTWPAADPVAGASIENDVHDDVEHTDSPSPAIPGPHEPIQGRTLTLDRWNFATVMFLVMFELEDPFLVRRVVMKVIAWMAEAEARVELTRATLWPRALHLPGAHPQAASLACAERLNATQAWVPAQVELVDAGPRGPPPLGC